MVAVIPEDDGFTEGTPAYNTQHAGYLCFLPRTTAVTIGPYALSGWSLGYMHDGQSVFGTMTGPLNQSYGDQCVAAMTGSALVTRAVCMVHREESSASDCEVSICTNVHRPAGGALASDMLLLVGVVARAQSGTVSGAGTTAHYIGDGDCYAFGLWNNSTNLGLYQLLRVNAGVVTVLETGDETGTYPGTAFDVTSNFYMQIPWVLRMEISDEAGNVRIRCYREHNGPLGSVGGSADWNSLKVIDYLDTSGSRITTAGRFGFFATSENTVGSVKSVQIVHWFKVEVGGTVTLLDEFKRVNRHLCAGIAAAAGYTSGNSLQSLWSGDAWCLNSPTVLQLVSTPAGLANRCMIDPGVAVAGTAGDEGTAAFLQYQRAASDKFASRRVAEFRISTNDEAGVAGTSPTARVVGVWMRGGLLSSSQTSLYNGYSVHVKGGGAGTCYVKVRRWNNGSATVIGEKTDTITFTLDADHTVDLEVYNLLDGEGNPDNGTVAIIVKVDGTQIVLTVPAGVSNVTALSSGTLYDADPSRILNGTHEGVLVLAPDGSNVVYVDDWTVDSTTTGGGVSANDEASISVAGEVDDLSGTLSIPYDWPVEDVTETFAVVAPFEDGYQHTRAKYPRQRRTWQITMAACTQTQRDTLISFWDAHKGVSFNWTPTGESTALKAVFADDALEYLKAAPSVHGYSFRLTEVF